MKTMTEYEVEKAYEEMMNECHEVVNIGGLEYEAGRVLRAIDPIAFRCGMIDWADGEGIEIED